MGMEWLLLSAFITGFLRNLVRSLTAKTHAFHKIASYVFAVLYGSLFAYIISSSNTLVASLWFGLMVALVIANKMTGYAHIFSLAALVSIIGIQGLSKLNAVFLILFAVVAIADEVITQKRHNERTIKNIILQFVGLLLVTLITSITTGIWMVFFSIVFYDIGFLCVDIIRSKKEKQNGKRKKKKAAPKKKISKRK